MRKKVYICGNCKESVNDSQKFCGHCGSQFDSTLSDDTFGIEAGDVVIDEDGNTYTVSEVSEDFWVLVNEAGEELNVAAEDFGGYTKTLDIEDGTVAFSVKKGDADAVKKQVLEVDPKASFSTFVPLSKQMEGIFVKTSKEADVESLLKENKVNVVNKTKMGYAPM